MPRRRSIAARLALVAVFCLAVTGCPVSDPPADASGGPVDAGMHDAGIDAARDASAPSLIDGGMACGGDDDRRYECTGGAGRECCHGRWSYFLDGPCWTVALPDAGLTPVPCGAASQQDCPCAEEGAIGCADGYHALRCFDGIWSLYVGRSCCFVP